MALVCLGVRERAGAFGQCIDDMFVDEKTSNRRISTPETLSDGLQVRHNTLLFPGVECSRAPHAANHFVKDKQGPVPLADLLYGFQVSGQWRHTPQCLSSLVGVAAWINQP